ncbi:hypothetical protein AAFF_G00315460 [Aldrovandia affinis]|uniref:Uncharacterized protein n=1 Tax=Aldrovandia affinis TaxID=143900 RepID=A0AAD7WQD5_9TELE|nr:hypothetical protein AAFF_G00315460 [Aldrovandia affinis]
MLVQIQSAEEQRRQHAQAMEVQIQNMELLRAELKERLDAQKEHALVERGAGDRPEDPPRRHLRDSATHRPSSVVFRKSTHKPPPTRSPRESPVRQRPWRKRKLGPAKTEKVGVPMGEQLTTRQRDLQFRRIPYAQSG